MEAPVSRSPLWRLHALIAEARRRARRRWLLVLLLLVVVAGVTAAVVLGSQGGGSRSGGPSGRVGGASAGSHSLHFGVFVLTVPKGFHKWEALNGPKSRPSVFAFWVAHHPRAASTGVRLPASGVYLGVQAHSALPSMGQRLPLDLHKLHQSPVRTGTMWLGAIYGGHDGYLIQVFEGSKASAADRAAIERALRSIRRAS